MTFTDTDADQLQRVTQNLVMDYLRQEMNSGAIFTTLGKKTMVTPSVDVFSAAWKQGHANACLLVYMGALDEVMVRQTPDGVRSRYEIKLNLDMSMCDHVSESSQPAKADDNDRKMVDAVRSIVKRGYAHFRDLGMEQLSIAADEEKQKAGMGRNPMIVSFACSTLTTS